MELSLQSGGQGDSVIKYKPPKLTAMKRAVMVINQMEPHFSAVQRHLAIVQARLQCITCKMENSEKGKGWGGFTEKRNPSGLWNKGYRKNANWF